MSSGRKLRLSGGGDEGGLTWRSSLGVSTLNSGMSKIDIEARCWSAENATNVGCAMSVDNGV